MKTLSRLASNGEILVGVVGAILFWLLDATVEKYLFGCTQSFMDILFSPGSHEFRIRVLATGLILIPVAVATLLLRRKENAEAKLQHGRFLLEEMAVQLGHKNERLKAEISRRKAVEERLEMLAGTDPLTGIHNRRKFDELFRLALRQEDRYQHGLCLVMLDIDHFKEVNDRHGHAVGDEVLKELALLVEETRREADSFFRVGGEEFCLLTYASNGANLETACEKLRKAVASHEFDEIGHITVSLGASQYQSGDTQESLFKRVDAALYRAKQTGRDRVVIVSV
jgi:diguanylate cyclase (GGDEF)-like protein